MNRQDIDVTHAIQGDLQPVVLVRSAWDAVAWDSVRADILARIAAGQTPVLASHLQQLGLYDVVRLVAEDPTPNGG
jgi:hypothetical protein|tara:strand:+ start:264 stop:491 length:228 start_codon:yes stop_codon:yes gene_type:complete